MKFLVRYWFVVVFALVGIIGGFLYWRFIGCNSGSCPITSNWHSSLAMGGLMGYLTGSIFDDMRVRKSQSK